MRGYIYITLKSDLCAASGDGFSLSIDTDVCADKYGFPFIPARRIKGCLREAACYIGENVDSVFGVSGDMHSGSLRICDARFADYASYEKWVKETGFTPEKVLSLFTTVKASTAIENDTVKPESLRFVRVVNHYSPLDLNELVFKAEVECDEMDREELVRICKALRGIGYKRNRGYGSVKCWFEEYTQKVESTLTVPDDGDEHDISFSVRLTGPTMFAGKSSIETLDYIPGGTVLGFFAASYLKEHAADERFEEIFLSNKVRFSNLYIANNEKVAEPAPAVLGQRKGDKKIRFIFDEDNRPEIGEEGKLLRPKSFKGGYLISDTEIKPQKEIIYHNGKVQGEDKKLLYTQEVLSEGQIYSGRISGPGSLLKELIPILEAGRMRLGRSKTAQYSACDIIAKEIDIDKNNNYKSDNDTLINAGDDGRLFALLCSDVLVLDESAVFSTDIRVLATEIGIDAECIDLEHSSLKYTNVMGYVSVGRYKRSHLRAFEKGSVICFKPEKSFSRYKYIGERINEGFGEIKICKKEDLMKLGRTVPNSDAIEEVIESETATKLSQLKNYYQTKEQLRNAAIDYGYENNSKKKDGLMSTTSSFVGRLLLMVRQAKDYPDLEARVNSIKDVEKRGKANKFIKGVLSIDNMMDWVTQQEFLLIALTIVKYRMRECGNE